MTLEQATAITSLDDYAVETEPNPIIRKPGREDVITTTGQKCSINCILDRTYDLAGNFLSETAHPVNKALVQKLKSQLRTITFNACLLNTGEPIIVPQKHDLDTFKNTWNISLAQAMTTPPGHFFMLKSDPANQRYITDVVEESTDLPTYDAFEKDLTQALSSYVINSLEHPVVQKLLEQK